jgi:hypothetical protein
MSEPNAGLNGCGKVLVSVLVLTLVIMLATPSLLLATGPVGDPEPAPPVGIPGLGNPPTNPEQEGEGKSSIFLARGPIGDPEPAPPVGLPWSGNPPADPDD